MSANKKQATGLVPRLRFPEFLEAEGWFSGQLNDALLSITSGLILEQGNDVTGYKVTRIETIATGIIDLQKIGLVKTSQNISPYKLKIGDILLSNINSIAHIGKSAFVDRDFNLYHGMNLLRLVVNKSKSSPQFIFYLINTDKIRDSFRERANKAVNQASINQTELGKTPVALPLIPEQQKIADCLSSLDDLITAETQKLDALKSHKKGLKQQLFPREGETVPRLRFPEFTDTGKWERVMLGEIAEIKLGKMLDSKKHTTGNLLPYLNNLAVRWNEVDTSNLPKMYFDNDELDRFGLRVGDVVVCEGGEPGRSAVWDGRLPDLKFQKAVHRVRFKVPFEPRLLVLYLESIAGTPQLENLFTGGGIKHLTQEVFARLNIPFTCYAEQQRISDCLSSLDELITAQTEKIGALKTHKKGLMQQLFPVLDEARI